MKILLTGGGSGGHFYPLIAIAETLLKIAQDERLVPPELYFMSDSPYDQKALIDNNIVFKQVPAGKLRLYFSLQNILDIFKTAWGVVYAMFSVFVIYPDIVFSKGGYASVPAVFAARILRIPVFIHESDSIPGRANRWAGKFAKRVAVSYGEAAKFFPNGTVAVTGNPLRSEILTPTKGAHQLLQFDPNIPTILVLGGSQGALLINNVILDSLKELVKEFQVIHQTGNANLKTVLDISSVALKDSPFKNRYRAFPYLNRESLPMAVGCANIILSRAGSTIFEIAAWGKPSIIIPITDSNGDHQIQNALTYAQNGACIVIEEANLKPHILLDEIRKVLESPERIRNMSSAAANFAKIDAAEKISREIIRQALKHEA